MEEKIEGMYGSFLDRVRSFENRMGEIMTSFTSMFESPTLDPDLLPAPPKVHIQSDNLPARETFLIRTQPNPFASSESEWSSGRKFVSWKSTAGLCPTPRIDGFTTFIDKSGIPGFVSRPDLEKSIPEDGFRWYQLPLIVYSFIGIIFLMMTFVLTALLIRRNKLKKIRRARAQEVFSPVTAENSISTRDESKAAFEGADAPPEYNLVMDAAKGIPPYSPPAYSKNEEKRDEKSSEKPQNSPRD